MADASHVHVCVAEASTGLASALLQRADGAFPYFVQGLVDPPAGALATTLCAGAAHSALGGERNVAAAKSFVFNPMKFIGMNTNDFAASVTRLPASRGPLLSGHACIAVWSCMHAVCAWA